MESKVLYLHSDKTGLSRGDKKHIKIVKKLSSKYPDITMHKTSSIEDLLNQCKNARPTYDLVIICGGDGTWQQAISAIAELPAEQRPVFGYIPTGTVNDSAKSFGVKGSIRQAIKVLKTGEIIPIDICKANDSYFTFVVAIGQYTDISYVTPRKWKKVFGRLAYYVIAVKEAFTKKVIHVEVEIDGQKQSFETPFVMVCNGYNVGGFKVNHHNSIMDGLVDIYVTKPTIFNGITNFLWHKKNITHLKVSEARISTDEKMPWCIDGESGFPGDLKVQVLPGHINVIGYKKIATGK